MPERVTMEVSWFDLVLFRHAAIAVVAAFRAQDGNFCDFSVRMF